MKLLTYKLPQNQEFHAIKVLLSYVDVLTWHGTKDGGTQLRDGSDLSQPIVTKNLRLLTQPQFQNIWSISKHTKSQQTHVQRVLLNYADVRIWPGT
jgi:hypothetical protein